MFKGFFTGVRVVAAAFGLALAAGVAAPELDAQRRWDGGRGGARWDADRARDLGARRGAGGDFTVERVIRLAGELELTETQRGQLEAIRVELLEMRTARAARQLALMSEIQAGIAEPEAMRAWTREGAEEGRETLGDLRERYQAILTQEQSQELRRLTRRSAWRDRDARGGRESRGGGRIRDSRGRIPAMG